MWNDGDFCCLCTALVVAASCIFSDSSECNCLFRGCYLRLSSSVTVLLVNKRLDTLIKINIQIPIRRRPVLNPI